MALPMWIQFVPSNRARHHARLFAGITATLPAPLPPLTIVYVNAFASLRTMRSSSPETAPVVPSVRERFAVRVEAGRIRVRFPET